MDPTLRAFIRANYAANPAASIPLKQFAADFRATLEPREAAAWSRSRLVSELASAGYALGTIVKVLHVGGLAPRQVELRVVGGKLEPSHA